MFPRRCGLPLDGIDSEMLIPFFGPISRMKLEFSFSQIVDVRKRFRRDDIFCTIKITLVTSENVSHRCDLPFGGIDSEKSTPFFDPVSWMKLELPIFEIVCIRSRLRADVIFWNVKMTLLTSEILSPPMWSSPRRDRFRNVDSVFRPHFVTETRVPTFANRRYLNAF